jgi:hypothetical protein
MKIKSLLWKKTKGNSKLESIGQEEISRETETGKASADGTEKDSICLQIVKR